MNANEIQVLKLTLHEKLLGYLVGYQGGKNVLSFADSFKVDANRSTFSLVTHPNFPYSEKLLETPWARSHKLHPILSNLLPEGSLRALLAQGLKVHSDNEFQILSYLGRDLPGALIAEPLEPSDVPDSVLALHAQAKPVSVESSQLENKFSLAGVQMKFSMKEQDGRYNLSRDEVLGDWIVKTPSTLHKDVPLNEYTAMYLASLVGVEVPEIKLVELSKLDNLPQINLPNETFAFAIKRFDRHEEQRIHMEDFAQVLVKDPDEKYSSANYEQIGKILYEYSSDGLADAQQFARRLLVNILLANGDAHLKNWSLLYSDKINPRLSPAYDIVTTLVYIEGESQFALNLAKTKNWYDVTLSHFESWATRAGIPWRAIKPHIDDVMDKARSIWPKALQDAPMNEEQKQQLKVHWSKLQDEFRI